MGEFPSSEAIDREGSTVLSAAYALRGDRATRHRNKGGAAMTGPAGAAGRMQIARGLRELLTRSGRTQSEVAKRAGVSGGTVNRYLDWRDRSKLTVPTVRAIAEACGATTAERDGLAELVRVQRGGWWMDHPAVSEFLDPFVSVEDAANYEHVYANSLVPGLLQTRGYATALAQAGNPRADEEAITQRVDARMRRQETLTRTPAPLNLWAVLDQAVLLRRVGNDAVMAEQIAHLEAMARRPNVEIQVLPLREGAHAAGSGGHFVVLGRDDDGGDDLAAMTVVYLELHRQGLYLDTPESVAQYKLMFDYLRSQAANASETRDLLTAARQEYVT